MALRVGPAVMACVREDTQIGEMLLGDWLRVSADAQGSTSGPDVAKALGPKTSESVLSGLRDMTAWAATQRGEGTIVLSRYLIHRATTRRGR